MKRNQLSRVHRSCLKILFNRLVDRSFVFYRFINLSRLAGQAFVERNGEQKYRNFQKTFFSRERTREHPPENGFLFGETPRPWYCGISLSYTHKISYYSRAFSNVPRRSSALFRNQRHVARKDNVYLAT